MKNPKHLHPPAVPTLCFNRLPSGRDPPLPLHQRRAAGRHHRYFM
ncbi:hypothetical protein DB31_8897 [Hyalangium minutum]|uniref:Uncharacterized protein n=1 Tax=Hyalangium minutum TaxID=394096 RepID=A0A085WG70_9BACT|nr:hypothetical protein DB31_8897 [Hyalangium minutum]